MKSAEIQETIMSIILSRQPIIFSRTFLLLALDVQCNIWILKPN